MDSGAGVSLRLRGFIYEINWEKSVPYRDVVRYQKEQRGFDNRILLKPRVGEHLVRLNGLLRSLIHRRWTGMVAALNRQEDSRLEEFLFGAQGIDLSVTRTPLWEIQEGRCFYCEGRIRSRNKVTWTISFHGRDIRKTACPISSLPMRNAMRTRAIFLRPSNIWSVGWTDSAVHPLSLQI